MFKVNSKNTRTRPEICWKSTIKAPCSRAFIVNFRQANAGWVLEVIKPFVHNVPFLYPLKTSGNCKIYLAGIDSHY